MISFISNSDSSPKTPSARALNNEDAARLWDVSAKLVNLE